MLRYENRVRILTQHLGGEFSDAEDNSIRVQFNGGAGVFTSASYDKMNSRLELGDDTRTLRLSKERVFDIVALLSYNHGRNQLLSYTHPPILQLRDYIQEEGGLEDLQKLQTKLQDNPSLEHQQLGGNRILAEYFEGVLLLTDNLLDNGANVIDFGPATPELSG